MATETINLVGGGYLVTTKDDIFDGLDVKQYNASGALVAEHSFAGSSRPVYFEVVPLSNGGYVVDRQEYFHFATTAQISVIGSAGAVVGTNAIAGSEFAYTAGTDGGFALTYYKPAAEAGFMPQATHLIVVFDDHAGIAGQAQLTDPVSSVATEPGGVYLVNYAGGGSLRLDADDPATFAAAPTETSFGVAASLPSMDEGDAGERNITFTVWRSGDISEGGRIAYEVVHGQTDASDFAGPTSGVVSFAPESGYAIVNLKMAGDTQVEGDESFQLRLLNPEGSADAFNVGGAASFTIRNDDDASELSTIYAISGPGNLAEGNSGTTDFVFTVTRTGDLSAAGAVDFFLWSPHTDSSDFAWPPGGTAYFRAGEASVDVHVGVRGDTQVEGDEVINVSLANARGGVVSSEKATATSVIINDDGSGAPDHQPVATNDTAVAKLGATTPVTGNILANDDAGPDGPLSVVRLNTTHTADTDGSDGFTQIGRFGTLTVQADGAYSYVLNSSPEPGVTDVFGYQVRDADGDLATASIAIQIVEGDGGGHPGPGGPTYFGVTGPGSIAEGNSGATAFAFTVTRGGDVSAAGAVDYFMWGDAVDASDFAGPTAGTAYFEAGETSKTVIINVAGDTTAEADEAFNVSLANARGGALAGDTSTATAVILDDDEQGGGDPGGEPGATTFAISGPGALAEGNGGVSAFNFTVTRSGDLSQGGAVDYWLWGDAVDGADFTGATAGTVWFEAGQSSATIAVNVVGDTTVEADEAFQVSIANARGGTIATDTGGAIILNDEGQGGEGPGGGEPGTATISVSGGGQITEGDSGQTEVVFTFTRSGSAEGLAGVDFWIWGDVDGADLTGQTGGTVWFADGETSKTVSIGVVGDTLAEPDEAFHLSIANARGAVIGVDTANALILQNDGWVVA